MITDEELNEMEDWGTSSNPSTTRLVVKEIRNLREAVRNIAERARCDDGTRTFADCIRDMGWIDDECRRLLNPTQRMTEAELREDGPGFE